MGTDQPECTLVRATTRVRRAAGIVGSCNAHLEVKTSSQPTPTAIGPSVPMSTQNVSELSVDFEAQYPRDVAAPSIQPNIQYTTVRECAGTPGDVEIWSMPLSGPSAFYASPDLSPLWQLTTNSVDTFTYERLW